MNADLNRRTFLASSAAALAATTLATAADEPPEMTQPPTVADCFALRESGGKIPVVFDTDIGSDVDDTWALLYLLNSPELDVKLISVRGGAARERASIAAKMLEACGRTDIPIATGTGNGGRTNQHEWVKDYDLDAYPGVVRFDPAAAIVEAVNASDVPMTVCAVGPVDNVAEALRLDPFIATKARFVGMYGSIYVGYDGADEPTAEANVANAPAALRTVLEGDWEPSITPLDTCGLVVLGGERYDAVRTSKAAGVPELMENYRVWLPATSWMKDKTIIKDRSSTLFDIVAVSMCFSEEWMQMETMPLEVTDGGMTVVNTADGRPTRCALKWRDLESYLDHVVERVTTPQS